MHLLHIGKTGGTALKTALAGAASPTHVLILEDHPTRLRSIPVGERVAFFVRDPLTRFVSGFLSRQRKGRPRYFHDWSAEEAEAFARFHTPNQLACALSSAEPAEREAAERAMRAIQHVRDSYWTWFESEAYLRRRREDVFFVGAQETLELDLARLSAKLGLAEPPSLPRGDVAAHRNPAGLDRALDATAERNLKAWYAADYRFLALCRALGGDGASGSPG